MNLHGLLSYFFYLYLKLGVVHRSKLQEFLIKFNSYRIQSVLSRINQTNKLKREVALLYGKVSHSQMPFLRDRTFPTPR